MPCPQAIAAMPNGSTRARAVRHNIAIATAIAIAIAIAMLCCALVSAAAVAHARADAGSTTHLTTRPAADATATLLWLLPACAAAPAELTDLAPGLATRGVRLVTVPYGAHGAQPRSALAALRAARAGIERGQRIAVGAAGDAAAEVFAAAREDASVTSIVLFDSGAAAAAGGHDRTNPAAHTAEPGAAAGAAIPLLQVFDARCSRMHNATPAFASAAAFDAWLRTRYGAVLEDATRLYPGPGDADLQCRAVRDARFVDGAWTRARRTGTPSFPGRPCGAACGAAAAPTWLALREDERQENAAPARAGARPTALEVSALTATLADYIAAFIMHGNPNVRGRPQWPTFDDGARRYLHLGATVRATRDPLVDVLDLQAALDAHAAREPPRAVPAPRASAVAPEPSTAAASSSPASPSP